MSHTKLIAVATLGLALLLAACSSPQERIEENQAVFNSLPIAQQELIKQGRVAIGFGEEGVKLALGDPDRITQRSDEKGTEIIWRYVEYQDAGGAVLYSGYYHRYYAPYYAPFYAYPYYLDYPTRQERDVQRVVFRNGKVIAVEQELR